MNKRYYIIMRKFTLFVTLLFASYLFSFAQDIEVKKFEPMVKDQTAALSPRKDINGVTCGLVKVQLKEPGAEFEGNVMGGCLLMARVLRAQVVPIHCHCNTVHSTIW